MLPELGIVGTCLFLGLVFNALKDLKTIRTLSQNRGMKVSGPGGGEGSRALKYRASNVLSNKNYALALALEGALVSYLVSGAFISVLYYPNFWVLLGFIVSLKMIAIRDSKAVAA
jgi:hypothetical protein